ncbi:MAG: class I SAM-dependent rRNA methyltransferase [Myxococcales bacterium]|nr:class I SAM-dependent rRNA methyltransferase [Myxococcales bacterium]
MRPPDIELPRFLEAALSAGHPWVYRDHVPREFRASSGTVVRVSAGAFTGYALWDAESQIALRVYSTREEPSAAWVADRVRQAWELRAMVRGSDTDAFRWVFGEGDGLPGIVVDLYGKWAVIALYADGLERIAEWVAEALRATTELAGLVRRGRDAGSRLEVVWGRKPPSDLVVAEHGVRMTADLELGQKTGLFLDHRENRLFVGSIAAGRRVLNLFSYTGAFSLYAARAGATQVTSVDVAAGAMDAARDNFRLNGLDADAHDFVVADVFEHLEQAQRSKATWDLVISDPPSFARSKQHQKQALRAYAKLNALAMQVTSRDGLLAAASCTSQVSPDAFRQTLAEAATIARRRFQIIHEAGQPVDHPVLAQHLEGRYLKFVVGRVLPLA